LVPATWYTFVTVRIRLATIFVSQKNQPDGRLSPLALVNTQNWSDDNDTVSYIAILDTTAIPEIRFSISMSFRIHQPL